MYTKLSILICVICFTKIIFAKNSGWADFLTSKVISEQRIHQITIFTNNSSTMDESREEQVFEKVISKFPTVLINLADEKNSLDQPLYSPIFRNSHRTTLCIITLQTRHKFYFQDFQKCIHTLVELSPIKPRPKCLVIFLDEFKSPRSYEIYSKALLDYAWSRKFINFAIVRINRNNDWIIADYNPFTKTYSETSTSQKKLFSQIKCRI